MPKEQDTTQIDDFITSFTLYKEYPIQELADSQFLLPPIDAYCLTCRQIGTFHYIKSEIFDEQMRAIFSDTFSPGRLAGGYDKETERKTIIEKHKPILGMKLTCTRCNTQEWFLFFKIENDVLFKIGQWPSIENMQQPYNPKYKTILSDDQLDDYKRGKGLFAHGIGVGSYVYMRRVIEFLVRRATDKLFRDKKITEEEIAKSRWTELIEKLDGYLPDFLVKNKKLYSILSKGIHELSEEECLTYFPSVRGAVDLILEQEIGIQEKIKSEKKLSSDLDQINARTASKKGE